MNILFGLLIINIIYFSYHFSFKRHLKFKSALYILKYLKQAQKENKRLGVPGWINDYEYQRERKVYGLKFQKITEKGVKITEIK